MHATQFALTHTKTHTQTDISLSCYVLLSSITRPQSACFFISTQKVGVGIKNINCPLQRKVEIITFRQIRLVQLMSWCVSSLNTSACHLTLSTSGSCTSFTPTWTKGRYAALLFLHWTLSLFWHKYTVHPQISTLNMSNENKGRAKAEIHSHLRVPVIFHKTECHVLRVVHHYAW